jgi:hypothetical protein
MDINSYLVIFIIILILAVYYLYNQKESFKEKATKYEDLPDKIVEKLRNKPSIEKLEKVEKKEKPKSKEDLLKDLYDKYGI